MNAIADELAEALAALRVAQARLDRATHAALIALRDAERAASAPADATTPRPFGRRTAQ